MHGTRAHCAGTYMEKGSTKCKANTESPHGCCHSTPCDHVTLLKKRRHQVQSKEVPSTRRLQVRRHEPNSQSLSYENSSRRHLTYLDCAGHGIGRVHPSAGTGARASVLHDGLPLFLYSRDKRKGKDWGRGGGKGTWTFSTIVCCCCCCY